jgi:hypothetical protein
MNPRQIENRSNLADQVIVRDCHDKRATSDRKSLSLEMTGLLSFFASFAGGDPHAISEELRARWLWDEGTDTATPTASRGAYSGRAGASVGPGRLGVMWATDTVRQMFGAAKPQAAQY